MVVAPVLPTPIGNNSRPTNPVHSPPASLRSIATKTDATVQEDKLPEYRFKLELVHSLPVIDLKKSIISQLVTRERHSRFLKWLRQNHTRIDRLQQVGLLLFMTMLCVPPEIGQGIAFTVVLCKAPSLVCTYVLLSIDMICILGRQYEFWFFSLMNGAMWGMLATFFSDIRVVALLPMYISLQATILMDANYRTFVSSVRGFTLLIPTLVVMGTLVYTRVTEFKPENMSSFWVGQHTLEIQLIDVFFNTLVTMIIFMLRVAYNKRKLLRIRNAGCKMVRCVIYRSNLVLKRIHYNVHTRKNAHATRVMMKALGITAPNLFLQQTKHTNHRQQVTLVSLKLSSIDERRTINPCYTPKRPIPRRWLSFLYINGALGFLLSAVTIGLPSGKELPAVGWHQLQAIPMSGVLLSSVFCLSFACSFQRDLLRCLSKNFGFLFSSLQFTMACLCLADMVHWDYRSMAILAAFMWYHWILLLDTLTPTIRQKFRFKKIYATPVLVGVLAGVACVVYALTFSEHPWDDRILFHWEFKDHTIELGTKSFLLNRAITIWVWSARLVWELGASADEELVFIRGSLDYYTPFETFQTQKRYQNASIVPLRDSEFTPSSEASRRSQSFTRARSSPMLFDIATILLTRKPSIGGVKSCRSISASAPSSPIICRSSRSTTPVTISLEPPAAQLKRIPSGVIIKPRRSSISVSTPATRANNEFMAQRLPDACTATATGIVLERSKSQTSLLKS